MNTRKWSVAATLAAAVAWPGIPVRAQQPPTAGHVLVLNNERTMEGDIVRDGDLYRIHHQTGETTVPASAVYALCADMRAAYTCLHSRSNLQDADERMHLAHWCRQHGLQAEAIAELESAVRLDPQRSNAQRLLRVLRQECAHPATVQTAVAPTPMAEPNVEINAEATGLFTTRIQPILMNTCMTCHGRDKVGNFHLVRVFGNPGIGQPGTRHNLAATLAQINREHPLSSPLLMKALTLHGETDHAPLRGRNSPAYQMLEQWVRLQADHTPAAEEAEAGTAMAPKTVTPALGTASASAEPVATSDTPFAGDRKEEKRQTHVQAQVPVDPFDPLLFNRMAHPERTADGAP